MLPLSTTNRCLLFKNIASNIWAKIARAHSVDVHCDETGITKDIITEIRWAFGRNSNIGLWAKPGYREDIHGGDIDLFIEDPTGTFHWVALQAKVLYRDGSYHGIGDKEQWRMLQSLEESSGCAGFFLFYNGKNRAPLNLVCCGQNPFKEDQFGCSIVGLSDIEDVVRVKANPFYEDFHPRYAHPWKELVCLKKLKKGKKLFTLTEVQSTLFNRNFYVETFNTDILLVNEDGFLDSREPISDSPIITGNQRVKRAPDLTIVVRTTRGINDNE